MLEQHLQSSSGSPQQSPQKQTLATLIDTIDFAKKNKAKSSMSLSDVDSLSSGHEPENKEKSKMWTADETELFHILLKKYGTDFHILSNFFPKKTKNQLKNRYKLYISGERKRDKEEELKLKAVSELFKEMEERQEKEEREDFSEGKRKPSEGRSVL